MTQYFNDEVKIGNKIYKIERHFKGNRTIQEAIYTVVKNEAFRNKKPDEIGAKH